MIRSTPGGTTEIRDGSAPYERDEVPGLVLGRGDQSIGLDDHLLLTDDAGEGLGAVAVGQRCVLDPTQGMGGVDEGHPPPFTREPPDLAAEPVVRVDHVVPPRLVPHLGPQHRGRK